MDFKWYPMKLFPQFLQVYRHLRIMRTSQAGLQEIIYRIPIVYFHPGDTTRRGVSSRIIQKADGYAANFPGGIYQYFHGNYVLMLNGEKNVGLYQF